MSFSCDRSFAHLEHVIFVVVVVGGFGPPKLLGSRRLRAVEFEVKRIFVDVLGHTVEHRYAVVSRIGADVAREFADVAGESGEKKLRPVLVVVVEKLIGSHADGEERGPWYLRNLPRQTLDRFR